MIDVAVTTKGAVSKAQRERARERLAQLDRWVPDPVLGARVMLRWEPNPRLEFPARAEAQVDVNGHLVCGRVAAATMTQAIDKLAEKLRRQLEDFGERRERRQRRGPQLAAGEWRHGAWSPPRPAYLPRAPEERELVRRKALALDPVDRLQAVTEMLDLDHDFYLFRDPQTGVDAVVYRREDGRIGLIDQTSTPRPRRAAEELPHAPSRFAEPITLAAAISEMNALSHSFMFFIDERTGRGNVIYMRHDGHYGLIEPAP